MRVSVIMPAYNREKFLGAAVESVIAQTFRDWELLIVDDGSTDRTAAIAREFERTHPEQIRVLSQRNAGVTVARNTAIRAAGGTHFAFLDSDDLWPATKLERQAELFASRPDLAFAYSGYLLIDEAGRPIREVKPDPRLQGCIQELLWLEDNEIVGATLMIGREALFKVGLFDERLKGAENFDLRLKLARLGPVAFVNEALYLYRKHDDSLTAQSRLMSAQFLKLVESHFDGVDAAEHSSTLRAQVMSRHWHREGDRAFGGMDLALAMRMYLRALPRSRRKADLVRSIARCVLGRRANQAWDQVKLGTAAIRDSASQG
jgi:glycosyltransferase involved in cell wall biosynthesis